MRIPATDIHYLEASVTVDFAVPILPKIKNGRIEYRLLLFTFLHLSFSALHVVSEETKHYLPMLFVFIKDRLGMYLSNYILVIFKS